MEAILTALIDVSKQAGPFAIVILLLLWLYYKADSERRELSAQLLELAKHAANTASTFADILEKSERRKS
jgi:hypothetical protein